MGTGHGSMTTGTPVSIVGFAACSSLGYSLESTLVAMGAGLTNFTDTDVPNEFGHPTVAASVVEGASRGERLAALIGHGLDDASSLAPPHVLSGIPLLVGVPSDLTRTERGLMQTAVEERGSMIGETRWFPYGRASTFAALAAGMDIVANGIHRFALIAGVDSLCAPAQISSLVHAGRVLSPINEGTIPGEAGALALLARTDDPIVDVNRAVRLEAIAAERGSIPFTQAQAVSADALTAAFRSMRNAGASRVHRIVAAHSGEGYFGRSFAHAYLREVEMMPEPLIVELIADRVGDVGAAAGILGIAFGVYLMVEDRRDGPSRSLTYSESDSGHVGAAIVHGSPTSWRRLPAGSPVRERG
jgi:3-oxoacyl-[acyl-carrier-protein] synthase I